MATQVMKATKMAAPSATGENKQITIIKFSGTKTLKFNAQHDLGTFITKLMYATHQINGE